MLIISKPETGSNVASIAKLKPVYLVSARTFYLMSVSNKTDYPANKSNKSHFYDVVCVSC